MNPVRLLLFVFCFTVIACQPKQEAQPEDKLDQVTENTELANQKTNGQDLRASNENKAENPAKSKYSKEEIQTIQQMKRDRDKLEAQNLSISGEKIEVKPKGQTKLYRDSKGKMVLPNACDLVTKEQMASWIKIPAEKIKLINGSPKKAGGDSRSCFFKWEDSEMPNTAVLIQLMRNSVEDEVPEWPTYFINSKMETGEKEMTPDGEKTHVFKPFSEFGDAGAYNADIAKWYWRIGNDAIVMVAFNTYFSSSFKSSIVSKIGKEIMPKLMEN